MSHLSILPTVLKDLVLLRRALRSEGYIISSSGKVATIGSGEIGVELVACSDDGAVLGWRRGEDGILELVGDLVRLSSRLAISERLKRISRAYALQQALQEAEQLCGTMLVHHQDGNHP
ncbi:hypothetical protein OMCYN_01368 [cyanobiont of Ornithocercus magnificus]|nr:hypothetical protein OMCYN_01368 [cyanobiont of Ornithocercus magnificus]